MRTFVILWLLLITAFSAAAQTYTVETVPNPKEQSNTFVSNPDGILTEETVGTINQMLASLEHTSSAQVAVVAIQSIGDESLFDFAQALFNRWGIGQKETDNGLLVLLVMDKRKIRFHTGNGLEGVLPDAVCKRIQRESMVPYFQSEDYSKGMELGIKDVVNILSDEKFAEEAKALAEKDIREHIGAIGSAVAVVMVILTLVKYASTSMVRRMPHVRRSMKNWLIWFVGMPAFVFVVALLTLNYPLLFGGWYFILWLGLIDRFRRLTRELAFWEKRKEFRANYEFLKAERKYWIAMCFFFPIPGLIFLTIVLRRKNHYRNHPRTCTACGAPSTKMSESTEDPFLTDVQIAEEKLKSVDYDVWKCTSCDTYRIETFEDRDSEYRRCKKCNAKAYHRSGTQTTKYATRWAEGSREETFLCKFCGLTEVVVIAIPMTSSSDSSDDSSGSSDSGSFGGGSSSGGGSESSW